MILQNIWRRVVGNVLNNISPSNNISKLCSIPQDFIKIVRLLLAVLSINVLRSRNELIRLLLYLP